MPTHLSRWIKSTTWQGFYLRGFWSLDVLVLLSTGTKWDSDCMVYLSNNWHVQNICKNQCVTELLWLSHKHMLAPGVANFECNNLFNHNLTLLISMLKAIYLRACGLAEWRAHSPPCHLFPIPPMLARGMERAGETN